jgi:beta-lactamase class A
MRVMNNYNYSDMAKQIYFFALILVCFAGCTSRPPLEILKEKIITELGKQEGVYAVAFKNLQTNEELLILENERFHAASTMKTPVMIEVFRQAHQGRFSLDDSIVIKNEFRSIVDGSTFSLDSADDSEKELYSLIGQKKKIRDLVYDMIIVSSNLATNLVIELVDAKHVTKTMRVMGAKNIEVLRGVEDTKAFEKGLINSTTAYDLLVIFEHIAKKEMIYPEASEAMINILLDQKFNEIIPAKLPKEVKVAHKTGNVTGVNHDSGIVFLPDGRKYVLVLLSKDVKDSDAGIKAMANVSEMLYKHVALR